MKQTWNHRDAIGAIRQRRSVALLAVCIGLVSCGRGGPSYTSSGNLELDRAWMQGCTDCEGPERFTELLDLSAGSDGRVFALDRIEPFVRRIDRDGAVEGFVRQTDVRGEAELPRLVVGMSEGAFAALYCDRRSVVLYDAAGGSRQTITSDFGRLVGAGYDAATDSIYTLDKAFLAPGTPFRIARIDLATGDTAPAFTQTGVPSGDRQYGVSHALDATRRRMAFGSGAAVYRIEVRSTQGQLLDDIERQVRRASRSAASSKREGGPRTRQVGRNWPADDPYGHFFQFDALEYDPLGYLWVLTTQAPEGVSAGSVFDIFDREGGYVLSAQIDAAVKPGCRCFVVTGDTVVAATTDSAGIDRIAAWQIPTGTLQR